jgi:hypothetical protein
MPIEDLLGRIRPLVVRRLGDPGAFLSEDLSADSSATYLLPRAEVPPETAVGDTLEVFVSLDSEDRPIATLRAPYLRRDDVGFLEVTAVTPIGAFLDWGLPKELLLPFREQTREVREGDRCSRTGAISPSASGSWARPGESIPRSASSSSSSAASSVWSRRASRTASNAANERAFG